MTVVAVVLALLGGYLVMLGSVTVGLVFADLITFPSRSDVVVGQGIVTIALGVVLLIVAAGLFGLERWAWIVAVGALAFAIADTVIGFLQSSSPLHIIGLVIAAAALVYLVLPNVRELFGDA